jgi:FkbM family methyltransferase
MPAANSQTADSFGGAISDLLHSNPHPFFVQVGGFDGESFDPLRRHIVDKNLAGLIVEPIPQYFEKLQKLYAGSKTVTPVHCAIAEENGERTIWRFNPRAIEGGALPPHFAGIVSFVMDDLLKDTGVLAASSPDEETRAVLRSQLRGEPVRCRTMNALLGDHGVAHVDILQIDTEGYDYVILKLFDFAKYRPAIVHYEHQHLSRADYDAAEALLRSHGYRIKRGTYDTLATHDALNAGRRFDSEKLRALAASLQTQGRGKDALLLLEHLESLEPHDPDTIHQLVRTLGAEGQALSAMEKLLALKSVTADNTALVAEIRAQMPAALKLFDAHLKANELVLAETYAAVFAALIPGNVQILNSALTLNFALGRKEDVLRYAAAINAIDRNHELAHAILTETRTTIPLN